MNFRPYFKYFLKMIWIDFESKQVHFAKFLNIINIGDLNTK